jgi:hypothetical protein
MVSVEIVLVIRSLTMTTISIRPRHGMSIRDGTGQSERILDDPGTSIPGTDLQEFMEARASRPML